MVSTRLSLVIEPCGLLVSCGGLSRRVFFVSLLLILSSALSLFGRFGWPFISFRRPLGSVALAWIGWSIGSGYIGAGIWVAVLSEIVFVLQFFALLCMLKLTLVFVGMCCVVGTVSLVSLWTRIHISAMPWNM